VVKKTKAQTIKVPVVKDKITDKTTDKITDKTTEIVAKNDDQPTKPKAKPQQKKKEI
jgi:hypothetical protein